MHFPTFRESGGGPLRAHSKIWTPRWAVRGGFAVENPKGRPGRPELKQAMVPNFETGSLLKGEHFPRHIGDGSMWLLRRNHRKWWWPRKQPAKRLRKFGTPQCPPELYSCLKASFVDIFRFHFFLGGSRGSPISSGFRQFCVSEPSCFAALNVHLPFVGSGPSTARIRGLDDHRPP